MGEKIFRRSGLEFDVVDGDYDRGIPVQNTRVEGEKKRSLQSGFQSWSSSVQRKVQYRKGSQ